MACVCGCFKISGESHKQRAKILSHIYTLQNSALHNYCTFKSTLRSLQMHFTTLALSLSHTHTAHIHTPIMQINSRCHTAITTHFNREREREERERERWRRYGQEEMELFLVAVRNEGVTQDTQHWTYSNSSSVFLLESMEMLIFSAFWLVGFREQWNTSHLGGILCCIPTARHFCYLSENESPHRSAPSQTRMLG